MPQFTAENLVPPDTVDMKTIRPFKKGERLDNQDGTFSSERTTSINIDGKEVLVPTLWMTPNGPVDLSRKPESIVRSVIEHEKRSKKKFPRFDSVEEATRFAGNRSNTGARATGALER